MQFSERAKQFTVDIARFVRLLPRDIASDAFARQLIRSAGSVSANHRAAFRSRSDAEAIAKLGIVEEEADECVHWLEILEAINGPTDEITRLIGEARQLLAMTIASIKTIRKRPKRAHD